MKKLSAVFTVAALATVSMATSAWWGGPYGNNGYDYGYPYYGYPYAAPIVAPLSEEQQQAMAEQQAKAFQEALEAQRKYSEQFANGNPDFPAPFAHEPFPAHFGPNFNDRDAHRQEMVKQMEERRKQAAMFRPANRGFGMDPRREEMRKQMEERRDAMTSRLPYQADDANIARRDEMRKQMEERRNAMMNRAPGEFSAADDAHREEMQQQMQQRHDEMMKRVEAQRKIAEEQQAAMRKTIEQRRAKSDI